MLNKDSQKSESTVFTNYVSGAASVTNINRVNADTINIQNNNQYAVLGIDSTPPMLDTMLWIDREPFQSQLVGQIESGQPALIEIVAAGGFGKSLLATWLHNHFQPIFAACHHPVRWVNFEGQPSFSTFSRWVLQEIGALVPDESEPDDKLIVELRSRLIQHRCLLIMDQLEAMADGPDHELFCRFLQEWQKLGRTSKIIITTRKSFLVEHPHHFVLGGFTTEKGAEFLRRRGIVASNFSYLEKLSSLADGHPLLLNLAASWLKETAESRLERTGLSFFEGLFRSSVGNPEAKVGEVFRELVTQLPDRVQTALLVHSQA